MNNNLYKRYGFNTRKEYLLALADYITPDAPDYANNLVFGTAGLLGPTEDFDGLLSMIADSIGYIPYPSDFSEA